MSGSVSTIALPPKKLEGGLPGAFVASISTCQAPQNSLRWKRASRNHGWSLLLRCNPWLWPWPSSLQPKGSLKVVQGFGPVDPQRAGSTCTSAFLMQSAL